VLTSGHYNRMSSSGRVSAWILALVLVDLSLTTGLLRAQSKAPDKILFLHLRMKDGAITLVKTATTPGLLKSHRGAGKRGPIEFELQNTEGAPLWRETMSDPSIRRYEYEDPDNPGVIKSKVVQLGEVEFVVRVPFSKATRRISFYRTEAASEKARLLPAGALTALPAKRLIAHIDLPVEEVQ
jgi:hypothetical protein